MFVLKFQFMHLNKCAKDHGNSGKIKVMFEVYVKKNVTSGISVWPVLNASSVYVIVSNVLPKFQVA